MRISVFPNGVYTFCVCFEWKSNVVHSADRLFMSNVSAELSAPTIDMGQSCCIAFLNLKSIGTETLKARAPYIIDRIDRC